MQTYLNKSFVRLRTVSLLLLSLFFANSNASIISNGNDLSKAQGWTDKSTQAIHFIENKGQILQTDGLPAPYVKYMLQRGNTLLYLLEEGGIAYQFNHTHYPEGYLELMNMHHTDIEERERLEDMQKEIRLETYRMDMKLIDANPHAQIITEGKSTDYINYYTQNSLFVHHYQKITYKEVYSGIDWVIYFTEDGGVKYDFVVQAGADPKKIKFQFTHQEELYIDKTGSLIQGNRMGRFTDKAPVSFQGNKNIETHFKLYGDVLSFELSEYDHSKPLIIDPVLLWATYYGGGGTDIGRSIAVDGSENVYLAGMTNSTTNIASGGYQNTSGGGFDAFLVKFNNSGVRQWATYYGGSGYDVGYYVAVDANENVYLSGETKSITNIASGGHQNTFGGGGDDAFLVKFNSSGVREWATYYGGDGLDRGQSVTVDSSGNVYLTGVTTSANNIASGGHQNTYGGGDYDAFLVKFNSSGVRQWATYYGGNGHDVGWSCAIDSNGNVFLAGQTNSTNNIASTGHQNIYGGGNLDAFLVKFNSSGVRQWATYYGGSSWDRANSLTVDNNGNVYLVGETESTTDIASGGHQNTIGGGWDAFLVKFNHTGVRQWATYYGGSGDDYGRSCALDGNGNVYLSGVTDSTTNIATGGHQNTLNGPNDAYLVKFNSSGTRQWATYYGGNDQDWGWSCAVDGSGNVYLAGQTNSTTNIASSGHQNTFGGDWDAFLVKFQSSNCTVSGSESETLCVNTQMNPITHTTTGATGIGTPGGLPTGVTASWNANTITISGIPTAIGTFNYNIPLTGDCGPINATGTIIVEECLGINDLNKISFQVYPNPNLGQFTIQSEFGGVFELMDIMGKIINTYNITTTNYTVIENLSAGMYFIREQESNHTVKLIIR